MPEIFLDNNATTHPRPEVIATVVDSMSASFGNPSSAHSGGDRARTILSRSREAFGRLIGAAPESIVFTSGATESNNWVLRQCCRSLNSGLVTSTIEHSSIKACSEELEARHIPVQRVPTNKSGRLDPDRVADAITPDTALVSIHWVNNETGVIQPVAEIASMCRERRVLFHTDASQAAGKLPIDVGRLNCDFMSISAHKFHGPQGVGGLYIRPGVQLSSFMLGGMQESGNRGGTENVPGIAGAGTAAMLRLERLDAAIGEMSRLRDLLETLVLQQIPNVSINGDQQFRVCNTTNLQIRAIDGQALIARLSATGIQCSQSSACMNNRPEPSYVLREMGLSEPQAYASIRLSTSEFTTDDEVHAAVTILSEQVAQLRKFAIMTA